jgi:hypothetical protein
MRVVRADPVPPGDPGTPIRRRTRRALTAAAIALASVTALAATIRGQQPPEARTAEARAVAYLSAEVPRWRREHPCYSCHNNGDALRALVAAASRGHAVDDAIADTAAWLAEPERWDSNELRGGSEDLPLARIQFASALAALVEAGRAAPAALERAAALVVMHQREDGSWRLSESQILGGPTFYGTSLATAMARRTLAAAGAEPARRPLSAASEWLRAAEPETVLDASAILIGLERDDHPAAAAQRARALAVLARGQAPDGGWGPYVTSPSEVFDTALAVLALAGLPDAGAAVSKTATGDTRAAGVDPAEAIRRGRAYLAATQNADGSWPETTRPPGGESYAQRISTSAWALLALIESD